MKYLSLCSGIEAASVGFPRSWGPVAFSEIDPFPSAVLKHRFPNVPNWGDMTKFEEWPDVSIDLICGGTPCQSFSVAGLRKGLDDPRGNLMLTFGHILGKYRPTWFVWENVPGVLSSDSGRDFASFLGLVTGQNIEPPADGWRNAGVISGIESAYGIAYRVLDAQYTRSPNYPRAVPQRRRRVFVVGHLGDWRRAAAVLLDSESLSRDPPPRREAGERVAGTLTNGFGERGVDSDQIANGNYVAHTLKADGFDASEDGTGRGTPIVPVASRMTAFGEYEIDGTASRLKQRDYKDATDLVVGVQGQAVAFTCKDSGQDAGEVSPTLRAMAGTQPNGGGQVAVMSQMAVRRLLPVETERLQGFEDGWTDIPWRGKPTAPDGPRYKAIGNSFATNVIEWIGWRIGQLESELSLLANAD